MPTPYSLVLLNGAAAGSSVRLESAAAAVTIGRHSSCELALDDHRASRQHARLSYRAGQWHLEDLGSLNGTFVNSQPVKQTVLMPGDLVRIAERLILFVQHHDADSEPPRAASSWVHSTTLLGQLPALHRGGAMVEQSLGVDPPVIRDSAVLCRLAMQLHQQVDPQGLLDEARRALVDGLALDAVCIWLAGPDGRLQPAARWGDETLMDPNHLLASLALEKNKALLIRQPSSAGGWTDDEAPQGAALSVPMAGPRGSRGAIECCRGPDRPLLARSALDFALVVAHQTSLALENLEQRERLEQANEQLRSRLEHEMQLIGSSGALERVRQQIARVGPTAATVLILGESGTGKELVAHAIHELSRHRSGPFVAVNCAAFSDSLLESELFGHEAGAFTGAERRHIGQFERAHQGTIFLDEVGEMSPACQAKLLRLLEGHPFQRLGGSDWLRVEVRLLAATNRNLWELVQQGRFREDLYYRLRVIDLQLPPLRERGDDVLELATLFLDRYRRQVGRGPLRLSAACRATLCAYAWPGNVRELKNAMERAVVLGTGDELQPGDLGLALERTSAAPAAPLGSLREAERRHILDVLKQVDGNKSQACRILGIGRGTLYKKLEEPG